MSPTPTAPADARAAPKRALGREYFEALYERDPDPWNFQASPYEAQKFAITVSALGGRRFSSALDVGCSNGVLTEQLAEHADALLAVDVSERASSLARRRLQRLPHVQVQRRTLPSDMPEGAFELVVCSEVLYYWDRDTLLAAIPRLTGALAPGGVLLAVHWTLPTRTYPLQGNEVHELLGAHLGLRRTMGIDAECFRLDRFERSRRPEGPVASPRPLPAPMGRARP